MQQRSRSAETETRIAAEISRLLAHYWAANEDPRLRAALAGDWLNDLRQFDAVTVALACTEWRRTQSRRPTIADIRAICIEHEPPRPQQPITLESPHPFATIEDFDWLKEHEGGRRTEEDRRRIAAYRAAAAALGAPQIAPLLADVLCEAPLHYERLA